MQEEEEEEAVEEVVLKEIKVVNIKEPKEEEVEVEENVNLLIALPNPPKKENKTDMLKGQKDQKEEEDVEVSVEAAVVSVGAVVVSEEAMRGLLNFILIMLKLNPLM